MSAQKTISNSFTVTTMESPVSVQAQYAPNNNPSAGQIHNVWQDGDLYMRTRETDSNVWSSWHKIVGESGDETDFSFGISAYKTTANATTAPSDISSWSDAPLAVTSAKPYLWAKVQKKSWNASTQSYDVDSTTYIRLTGEDGSSVMAQYAPNNNPSSSQIHDTWQSGDLYMRTKSTTDSNWSSWHKIVGESGDETDYSFNISKSKTSTNSTTPPSDCYYTIWQDAPVAPTSTYPYMWMKIVKKTWNESTQSYDSGTPSYARVTGEKGDKGADAPYVELSRSTILYQANNDGYSIASQNFPITYALKVNGNTCTISSVNNITISLPTNVTVVSGTKTTSGCTINCTHSVVMSGVITITITGTYNGISYTATGSITVSDSREGPQGEQGEQGIQGAQGKIGRFYYYAQDWTDSEAISYPVTDAQAPYFKYGGTAALPNYWVFNPETNGTYTMHDMGTPSSQNPKWELMTNDFKYIITEAIFGAYAHFGSFIINGDWMISQRGQVNNVDSTNYQLFDPNFAKGNYLCRGESVDSSYKNAGSATFIGGKTYQINVEGESFLSASGTATMNVRMYNGSSTVGSTIQLTANNPTGSLSFTPPSTGTYYLRVDMNASGQTASVTASVTNVFVPNFAVDALQGTSYQHDGFFGGVIEAEDVTQGNKIILDVKNGGFKMTGPKTITDDDYLPSGNVRETLAEIKFSHDPDTLTRLAYMILQNGHKDRVINIDPHLGISIDDTTFGESNHGGIGEGGCTFNTGEGDWYEEGEYNVRKMSLQYGTNASTRKILEINIDGITYKEGNTTKTKTWAQLLG